MQHWVLVLNSWNDKTFCKIQILHAICVTIKPTNTEGTLKKVWRGEAPRVSMELCDQTRTSKFIRGCYCVVSMVLKGRKLGWRRYMLKEEIMLAFVQREKSVIKPSVSRWNRSVSWFFATVTPFAVNMIPIKLQRSNRNVKEEAFDVYLDLYLAAIPFVPDYFQNCSFIL